MPRLLPRCAELLALLGGLGLARAADTCEGETCGALDDPSLLQINGRRAAAVAPHVQAPHVWCNSTPTTSHSYPQGSGMDKWCSGNQCCPQYGKTYPCPSADAGWNLCVMPAVQGYPDGATYTHPPLPPLPAVLGAYSAVVIPTAAPEDTLAEFLETQPGIGKARVLKKKDPDYNDAFYPPVVINDTHYMNSDYPSLWGDLGSQMQPGFGGVMTYNVVKLKPAKEEPLSFFRVTKWQDAPYSDYMCSIWWGARKDFSTDLVNVSINVATCSDYNTIMMCNVTEKVEAIVGQGWPISPNCYEERGCMADGKATQWVAQDLVDQDFPKPPADALQYVLPACQLSAQQGTKCRACQLPKDEAKVRKITDLAAYVSNPPEGTTCVDPMADTLLKKARANLKEADHKARVRQHR